MSALRRLLLVLAAFALPAHAEVELRATASLRPDVAVTPTQSGPWSPVGLVSSRTLNPSGDLTGDGYPGIARSESSVLVAWNRRAEQRTLLALGGPAGWLSEESVASAGAVGTPVPLIVGNAWVVVWQRDSATGPEILATPVSAEGKPGNSLELAAGRVVGAVALDAVVQVVFVSPDGSRLGSVRVPFLILPDIPYPISGGRTLYDFGDFVSGPIRGHSVIPDYPIPIPLGHHRSLVGAGHQAPPAQDAWFADVRITDGENSFGKFGLVTWWRQPGELAYVELREDGPVLPFDTLESSGEAAYPQSLLHEAHRIVRER